MIRIFREPKTQPRKPLGEIKLGVDSSIEPPRKLEGAAYIQVGAHTRIGANAWLAAYDQYAGQSFNPRLVVGDNVDIGDYACITCISSIDIGNGCLFSEFVYISDHFHGMDPGAGLLVQQPLHSKGSVRIGEHTFLGYRVCVLSGVTLGRHCVVGANSVVTHSFADYSMIAGAPARLIKRYSVEAKAWLPTTQPI